MAGYQHDPEEAEASAVVLKRIGETEGSTPLVEAREAEYARVRAAIVGKVVSTGDRFAGFEVIEIVPPDEPALVPEGCDLEFV